MISPTRRLRIAYAIVAAIVLIIIAGAARPTRGGELLPPRETDRKFPQGTFCPLPLDLSFDADGPEITLRISTHTVNYFNDSNQQNQWSQQQLDNICVVTEADYQAHHGPLGALGGPFGCYIGAPVTETFYFQEAGTIPLKEQFIADPSPNGWDVSNGCYWIPTTTGPNDPGTEKNFDPTGCLALGTFEAGLSLSDSAFTTKTVTGLTAGEHYRMTGWWNVDDMELGDIFVTVRIYGVGGVTPIALRTWGGLKRRFR